jgi:NADH dehydrogenase
MGRIIILGGGIAGISAKLRNRNAKLADENSFLTMAPRVIDIIGGKSPEYPKISRNTDYTGRVNRIDFNGKSVDIGGKEIVYDRLIIALGHSQNYDFIKGSRYVHGFSSLEDAIWLRRELKTKKRVVIIGGGYLGVELAGYIQNRHVTILEAGKQILTGLPSKFTEYANRYLSEQGVDIQLENQVKEVQKDRVITGSKSYESDITIFAGGFTGNLPSMAGDISTKNSKIVVNSFLQSPDYPDVYAAGDSMFVQDGGFIPMSAIIARFSGITAMENAMGYKHAFRANNFANIIRVGNRYFGTVGNTFVHGPIARIIKESAIALTANHAMEV